MVQDPKPEGGTVCRALDRDLRQSDDGADSDGRTVAELHSQMLLRSMLGLPLPATPSVIGSTSGRVLIKVLGAAGLPLAGAAPCAAGGKRGPDAMVVACLGVATAQTRVVFDCAAPRWDQLLELPLPPGAVAGTRD